MPPKEARSLHEDRERVQHRAAATHLGEDLLLVHHVLRALDAGEHRPVHRWIPARGAAPEIDAPLVVGGIGSPALGGLPIADLLFGRPDLLDEPDEASLLLGLALLRE